jgi:hypothetical protein
MAIDSAAKRRSAVCTRRLPWFRRFLPAPDAAIGQTDRQQLGFVYAGILVDEPAAPPEPEPEPTPSYPYREVLGRGQVIRELFGRGSVVREVGL